MKGLLDWLGPFGQAKGDVTVGHLEMCGARGMGGGSDWDTLQSLPCRQHRGKEAAGRWWCLTQTGPPGSVGAHERFYEDLHFSLKISMGVEVWVWWGPVAAQGFSRHWKSGVCATLGSRSC